MARLACRCLNINVFVAGSDWRSSPLQAAKLFSQQFQIDDDIVYEVNLDVAGIVVELTVLANTKLVGDWVINSCSNCQTDVFITHIVKGDRTFVLPGLLSDDEAIRSVCQHKDYSSIFKILLKPIQDEGGILRRKRVSSMSFGREDPDMKLVHQQMKSYLKSEEVALEERIRVFEEQQRNAFSALQENAHHQRSLLFAAIAKAREKSLSEAVHTHTDRDLCTVNPEKEAIMKRRGVEKATTQRVTITIQDKSSYLLSKLEKVPAEDDSQEDSLFALEGFDEEQAYGGHSDVIDMRDVAFPQSDDDDSSTNDSSFRDVSALSTINLATSVPVSIPLFKKPTGTSTSSDVHEAGDVGDSIRLLALSVQDTGMFGDLPRPRMMTNPFS